MTLVDRFIAGLYQRAADNGGAFPLEWLVPRETLMQLRSEMRTRMKAIGQPFDEQGPLKIMGVEILGL